ncbi:hypothetical protein VCHC17A1_4097B, partial [Vibrio cholerae HC-17A1]
SIRAVLDQKLSQL